MHQLIMYQDSWLFCISKSPNSSMVVYHYENQNCKSKVFGCASNQDVLLFMTLWYMEILIFLWKLWLSLLYYNSNYISPVIHTVLRALQYAPLRVWERVVTVYINMTLIVEYQFWLYKIRIIFAKEENRY